MDRSVTNVAKKTLHTTRYHLAKESIIKRLKRERKIIKSKYEETS